MKLQYCSDLHLEFPDNKEYILDNPIELVNNMETNFPKPPDLG